MTITERLKPHVDRIKAASMAGDELAQEIISLHRMHVACPSDPGAPGLCEAAFNQWISRKKVEA